MSTKEAKRNGVANLQGPPPVPHTQDHLDEAESQARRIQTDVGPHDRSETQTHSSSPKGTKRHSTHHSAFTIGTEVAAEGLHDFWDRFTRKGRKDIGVMHSLRMIMLSHWLNAFFVFIPLAWVAHFVHWPNRAQFVLAFLAIIPLERLLEYGGEQMCFYVGKDFGDLILITLNNTVEATLGIILLTKCELRLLQSTIVGVVILHLLLIPGTAFLTGGARITSQDLNPHITELNHVLLTIGVLSLLLPAAFFSALDRGVAVSVEAPAAGMVSNETREVFLQMSRGIAIILLLIYVASRIYLHNPPGDDNAMKVRSDAPEALREEEKEYLEGDPEVNQYVCLLMLTVVIAIMAATAEWLVESIEDVREQGRINEEWFGLVLLPIVSWSADGAVSIVFFAGYLWRLFSPNIDPPPPATLAKARAIDLSIQFSLFWMPFLVLLAWWTDRTFNLLFDMFEVAILLGACFLVNYVTADAKTNWAEGFVMISFYAMVALCAWFYTGQPEVHDMLGNCGHALEAAAESAAEVAAVH
ncbi:hypothetical protein PC9H_005325 [Pleurotus ostreatus]|uniref:Sodium/calcium exchanger membrane region domain-containing protein n=1 Tax=Pleurotus ostreatus TaxID=5322 RepID=A0A8H7DVF0_PLEOS|nr:uncharacterized protein PC9H_005325 [Pleurotus ostreatus]KAF7433375.1 hypothetical protein PC9H_005325 [Pleurotus ostreatus]KAJ8697943.1 hypothetical protein PTI98_004709 [Pleurotus ostreatus]